MDSAGGFDWFALESVRVSGGALAAHPHQQPAREHPAGYPSPTRAVQLRRPVKAKGGN